MKTRIKLNKVFIKKSSLHGYGVFAAKTIRKGEIIEQCYIIGGAKRRSDLALENYYFDANGKDVIFTGFGCIYNHSDEPNADYKLNMKTRIATFKADATIYKGEEIFVWYGDGWFSCRNIKKNEINA